MWEANDGTSALNDSNAIVFLSGPYKSVHMAKQYALSLSSVEIAASAGRWVASASLRSRLNGAVAASATCMGSRTS